MVVIQRRQQQQQGKRGAAGVEEETSWSKDQEVLEQIEQLEGSCMGLGLTVLKGVEVVGRWDHEVAGGSKGLEEVVGPWGISRADAAPSVCEGECEEQARESAARDRERLGALVKGGWDGWQIRRWLGVYGEEAGEDLVRYVEGELERRMGALRQDAAQMRWRRPVREEMMSKMGELSQLVREHGGAPRFQMLSRGREAERSEKKNLIVTALTGREIEKISGEAGAWLGVRVEEYERIKRQVDRLKEEVIERHMRLVWSWARKLCSGGDGKRGGDRIELEDLVQEGVLGLMKAVDKFEVGRGNRFSTYATWWIRQAITRAKGETASLVRAPVHVQESWNAMRRVKRKLRWELEREPSDQEVGEALGWSIEKLKDLEEKLMRTSYAGGLGSSLGRRDGGGSDGQEDVDVDFVIEVVGAAGSFHALAKDGASALVREEVMGLGEDGDWSMSYEKRREREERAEMVRKLLSKLDDQEREVVMLRFGIGVDREMTLEEVGVRFGVTRERIRQIEIAAMRELRGDRAKSLLKRWGHE